MHSSLHHTRKEMFITRVLSRPGFKYVLRHKTYNLPYYFYRESSNRGKSLVIEPIFPPFLLFHLCLLPG